MQEQSPLVSVCMITYNHEAFIEKAITSVLDQKTNFPFEVIVCDDKSTDDTNRICETFSGRNNFRLISNQTNVGPWKNLEQAFKAARGKYIALLEGDDYWTYAGKLQYQFDFLEEYPEY